MIGQLVVVVHSPYSSVQPGAVAKIKSVRKKVEETKSGRIRIYTLYELEGLPHRLFYKSETKPA